MSIFGFRYAYEIGVKGSFGTQLGKAEPEALFSDPILFLCVAFAVLCGFVDWMLSKEEKKRLKEWVGDYWTRLQYQGLAQLFMSAWDASIHYLQVLVGSRPFSFRRMLVTCLMQLLFAYIAWWLLLTTVLAIKGISFGPIYAPKLRITSFRPNIELTVLLLLWFTSTSWLCWSGFLLLLKRMNWTIRGTISTFLYLSLLYVSVAAISAFTLHEWIGLDNLWRSIVDAITPPKAQVTVTLDREYSKYEHIIEALFTALYVNTALAVNLVILIAVTATLVAATLGPLILFTFIVAASIAINLLLQKFAFVLEPFVSRVLARLYESDKGLITQVGVFVAAAAKLTEEAIKRFA